MIKMSYNNGDIYVQLSGNIIFDIDFLSNISKLFDIIKLLNNKSNKITFKCVKSSNIEKIVLAYINNICLYIKKNMNIKIFMSKNLYYKITGIVNNLSGEDYTMQEFKQEVASNDITHYTLHGESEFNLVVDNLTKFIMDTNVILDKDNVQLFLKTTIGEVFSNAYIHNKINEYYYFKDIAFENNNLFLTVNVVDYGNTITKNVEKYFHDKKTVYNGYCIDWAIGNGNTTREGSGGYGLPTLLDYIKKVEGDLTILSGDEIFSLKKGNKDFQEKINSFFPGTAICFKIKLFDLDKLFEYDKKNKSISTRRISLNDI